MIPLGNDTYMVSRQAATDFSRMGTLKASAMKEAYAECQKTDKAIEVLEKNDLKPPYMWQLSKDGDLRQVHSLELRRASRDSA